MADKDCTLVQACRINDSDHTYIFRLYKNAKNEKIVTVHISKLDEKKEIYIRTCYDNCMWDSLEKNELIIDDLKMYYISAGKKDTDSTFLYIIDFKTEEKLWLHVHNRTYFDKFVMSTLIVDNIIGVLIITGNYEKIICGSSLNFPKYEYFKDPCFLPNYNVKTISL